SPKAWLGFAARGEHNFAAVWHPTQALQVGNARREGPSFSAAYRDDPEIAVVRSKCALECDRLSVRRESWLDIIQAARWRSQAPFGASFHGHEKNAKRLACRIAITYRNRPPIRREIDAGRPHGRDLPLRPAERRYKHQRLGAAGECDIFSIG